MPIEKNPGVLPIVLYGLQTCGHCKSVRKLLQDRGVNFKTVYVDMLVGEERSVTLRRLKRFNPAVSFPTLCVGENVIVGFKKDAIDAALAGYTDKYGGK